MSDMNLRLVVYIKLFVYNQNKHTFYRRFGLESEAFPRILKDVVRSQ